MGRILQALKNPDGRCGNVNGAPHALHHPAPTEMEAASQESSATVPFIEVGPQRSMEGSPEVLSVQTPFVGPRLVAQPPEAKEERSEQLLPGIRGPRFGAELITYHRPEHAVSQQYNRLIQPLLAPAVEGQRRVLLFSAARPGCGTSTVLLNLAITAARHGRKRVVVVDGNLRRPALAERLGLGDVPGLRDVLTGSVLLERALHETDQTNLFAMPAGKSQSTQGIRYLAEPVRSLLRQLRQRFDLVLVDGPRWDGQPDVVLLASACDAIYLVVSEKEAESAQVDELFQSIPEQGICLAGCILA
jgi:Mrp family chromosome partitioning ATPase